MKEAEKIHEIIKMEMTLNALLQLPLPHSLIQIQVTFCEIYLSDFQEENGILFAKNGKEKDIEYRQFDLQLE